MFHLFLAYKNNRGLFSKPYLNTTLSPFHHDYYSIITSLANSIFSLSFQWQKKFNLKITINNHSEIARLACKLTANSLQNIFHKYLRPYCIFFVSSQKKKLSNILTVHYKQLIAKQHDTSDNRQAVQCVYMDAVLILFIKPYRLHLV